MSLTKWPEAWVLPDTLAELNCAYNRLMRLPELPVNLTYLYCENNNIASLPALPVDLEILSCSSNALTSLPELPKSLTGIAFSNNPGFVAWLADALSRACGPDYTKVEVVRWAENKGLWYMGLKAIKNFSGTLQQFSEQYPQYANWAILNAPR